MLSSVRIKAIYNTLFNERVKHYFEQVIIILGIIGFSIHLLIIFLFDAGIIELKESLKPLFANPVAAIYTPFSFILIYEVYLLVYYLPESFTTSIGKQFEIISLIEIRNLFKDIAKLKPDVHWFSYSSNVIFTIDIIGFVVLFYLIYWFYRLKKERPRLALPANIGDFVLAKQLICSVLLIILVGLSIYSLVEWLSAVSQFNIEAIDTMGAINNVFYDEFFSVLIAVDVFILIISFKYTEKYSQLIRNSGFVISTILIRLSFSSSEMMNMILIVVGVLFGVVMLKIYNLIVQLEVE